MNIFSVKKSIIIANLLILLVILVILFLIIIPSLKQTFEIKERAQETQRFLENQYKNTKLLKRSILELDNVKEKTNSFKQFGIPMGEELSMITRLETLAQKYNLEQNLNVETSGEDHYIFAFSTVGTMKDQISWLEELETWPYYFIIDKMTWSKASSKEEGKENLVALSFRAKIFVVE